MDNQKDKYSYFGFKKIPFLNKQRLVNQVFSEVSSKYDIMNDIMSLGMHRKWKKKFINFIPDTSMSLLDIASGSGDIAYNYLLKANKQNNNPYVAVCDINKKMLDIACNKYIDKAIIRGVDFIAADAMLLPYQDESFDYITISFGIRNFADIEKSLREIYRVLKQGGKFVCMEFSPVNTVLISKIYDMYSFKVIPALGKFIANKEEAYKYLIESIRKFPSKENFAEMIKLSNFKDVRYESINLGIVAIHYGYKL